jgi:hypothetical protein
VRPGMSSLSTAPKPSPLQRPRHPENAQLSSGRPAIPCAQQ